MVARYGGEEFLIVLYDSDASGALGAARRIMARVNDLALPHPASTVSPQVTVSIGYATATVDRVSDPQRLIEEADQALYEAKRKGRNQISARGTPGPA
jgi:diguanylate cyclase (GGDEF)-like protein